MDEHSGESQDTVQQGAEVSARSDRLCTS